MTGSTGLRFKTIFLSKHPLEDERAGRLLYWCRRFHRLGLTPKSAGNLSFRTEQGFIITGTGINLETIDKEELVEVSGIEIKSGQTLVYARGQVIPSKESLLHSEIYTLRADVNVVFHVHDPLVLEFTDKLKIPCTETEQPRGSDELVQEAGKLLGRISDISYFVLRNHGVVALGENLDETGRLTEDINKMARKEWGDK